MRNVDSFIESIKSLPFSFCAPLMGIRAGVYRNFSDLKFAHIEKADNLNKRNKDILSFLKKSQDLKPLFCLSKEKSKEEMGILVESLFLKEPISKEAFSIIKTEKFFFALNFSSHLEAFLFSDSSRLQDDINLLISSCERLENISHFAFLPSFGFLSEEPLKSGNMLSLKAFLHLPALKKAGKINSIMEQASIFHISFSSVLSDYPETGAFYCADGNGGFMKEEEFVEKFLLYLKGIYQKELQVRKEVYSDIKAKDPSFRSIGILQNCRTLGFFESLSLLSDLKLGCEEGFIKTDYSNAILLAIKSFLPANIKFWAARLKKEEDILRAEISRKLFAGNDDSAAVHKTSATQC